jgi:hypothetical protein
MEFFPGIILDFILRIIEITLLGIFLLWSSVISLRVSPVGDPSLAGSILSCNFLNLVL